MTFNEFLSELTRLRDVEHAARRLLQCAPIRGLRRVYSDDVDTLAAALYGEHSLEAHKHQKLSAKYNKRILKAEAKRL